jgi:hypothetical protein
MSVEVSSSKFPVSPEHELRVTWLKSGTGLTGRCACGKLIQRSTGCNRSGLDYAWWNLRAAFFQHLQKVAQ